MRRTAHEVIRELEMRVARLERQGMNRRSSNRIVDAITKALRVQPEGDDYFGYTWKVKSHRGTPFSLIWKKKHSDVVEFLDEKRELGLRTDSHGIGFLPVSQIPKYFR